MNDDDPLDEKLRRAWHGMQSTAQVAAELGLSSEDVKKHWHRMRADGKLRRRLPSENQSDGRPTVDEYADDPLAEALAKGKR